MSIREKAIQGVLWSALQNWGSQVGSLLVFFLLARLLTPEAFGLVAMANIFLAFMQIFLQQGFAQSLIQRQDLEPDHIDTAFWTNLAIGACLTGFGLIAAGWVAAQFQQPQLVPILQVLSLLFLITACGNVQQALLERAFNFRATATRALAATLVGGVAGIGLALTGFGVWSLVGQQVIQELIGTLVLWQASDWRPRFKVSLPHFWQLFHFGMPILGFNFLNFLNSRADDLLIGYFLGAAPLGYYSIAYRILGVMQQLLVQTSQQIALPTFSRLQSDLEQFRQAFYTATQLTSLIAFPAFLGVLALAPELVVMLFGEQWIPSIPVLQVLSLAGIFQSISFFKSSVFMAMGKPSWSLWLSLLTVVLNLIGFSIAVRWDIVAVAAAFVIRGYLVFPIGQWAVSRLIHVPVLTYIKQFTAPLVSAIMMTGFVVFIKNWLLGITSAYILVVSISALLGALLYIGLIRFSSPALFDKLLAILQSPFSKKVKASG
jgi:PST family polysaccharide transporter